MHTRHRLLTIALAVTLAGCAAPGAVIRGSLSLPGAPSPARQADARAAPAGASSATPVAKRAKPTGGGNAKAVTPVRAKSATASRDGEASRTSARHGGKSASSAATAVPLPDGNPFTQAVLFIDRVEDQAGAARSVPAKRIQMSLDAAGFQPHVVAIGRGDTVAFMNRDRRWHNAFSISPARPFDLGSIAPGTARALRFDKPGPVRVFCKLHADSSAYIYVAPSPYYVRPDARGAFAMPPLPPGSYTVRGWHPRFGERRWRVELPRTGVTVALNF